MRTFIIMLFVTGMASATWAQANVVTNSPAPKAGAIEQSTEARRQLMESASFKELQAAVATAEKEYDAAASAIPEIKAVDQQIIQLMMQVRELRMKRIELEKKSPVLQEKQAAVATAIKAMHEAIKRAELSEQGK